MQACCIDAAGGGVPGATTMSHPTTKRDNNGALLPNSMADATLTSWLRKAEAIKGFNEGDGTLWTAIDTDIRIVVARPFIEHLMHSVIMTKSGRETGATL